MAKIKKLIYCIIIGFVVFSLIRRWDKRADGFTVDKITTDIRSEAYRNPKGSEEEFVQVQKILNQPFYYFARGCQSYAFESEDKKWVIKFIRYQRLRPGKVLDMLPDIGYFKTRKERKEREWKQRKENLFRGFEFAYAQAKDATGVVWVHFADTENKYPSLKIYDLLGNAYTLPLGEYDFVLQKKAVFIKPTIDALMQKNDLEGAKKRIQQIFFLLSDCAHRGIRDVDGALIRKNNMGFLEDENKAIYIDVGLLVYDENLREKKYFVEDLKRLQPLYSWLKEQHPELACYFQEEKQRVIAAF